jgi:ankyrin repeat protein
MLTTATQPILVSKDSGTVDAQFLRAAEKGTLAEVRQAVDSGANLRAHDDMNCDALGLAAIYNPSSEVPAYLMELGLDNVDRGHLSCFFLHGLAAKGRADLIDMAVERGTPVDTLDRNGETALTWAAVAGQVTAISHLLDHGANIGALDRFLRTPLHKALDAATVEVLVDAGAALDMLDAAGRTPLMTAVQTGRVDACEGLIKRGADLNATDQVGNTPILQSVEWKQADAMRILLDAGADLNVTNKKGEDFAASLAQDPDMRSVFGAWQARRAISSSINSARVVSPNFT